MQLADEYIARHALAFPLAKHMDYGTVFLRKETKNAVDWSMLEIRFRDGKQHPGNYNVRLLRPIHNAYSNRGRENGFFKPVNDWNLEWDEYEDVFIGGKKDKEFFAAGYNPVKTMDEIVLTGWEMFSFIHDEWLAKFASNDDFAAILDTDLNHEKRYRAYQNFTSRVFNKNEELGHFKFWSGDMMEFIRSYCHWLVDLK